MQQRSHTTDENNDHLTATDWARESLSRYLDGDLPGDEAGHLAATLSSESGLREELRTLVAVRTALRHHAPEFGGKPSDQETMRLRTFARLHATVENDIAWQKVETTPRRVSFFSQDWLAIWRPAATMLVTAATVVGIYLLVPQQNAPVRIPRTAIAAKTLPLHQAKPVSAPPPSDEEMSVLFDMHDAHGAGVPSEDILLHRHRMANAQAALLDRADRAIARGL